MPTRKILLLDLYTAAVVFEYTSTAEQRAGSAYRVPLMRVGPRAHSPQPLPLDFLWLATVASP